MITYLGIGTNLGDLAANLNRAVALIAEQAGHLLACSSYVKSEPWGFHSENIFLNAVVAIDTPYTPHRILAINRAENEGVIKAKIECDIKDVLRYLERHTLKNISKIPEKIEYNRFTTPVIKEAIEDSYKRLISPAIEREIRNYFLI